MRAEALHHQPWGAYAFPVGPDRLKVRLRAARGDLVHVTAVHGPRYYHAGLKQYPHSPEQTVPLRCVASDELFDYFEGTLHEPTRRLQYAFLLDDGRRRRWYGPNGPASKRPAAGTFLLPHLYGAEGHDVPGWARGAVFYEIFPERFCNGDPDNDPPGTVPWNAPPPDPRDAHGTFYGGDLRGIVRQVPYLAALGVEAVWLTPIFKSPSTHKYDTEDYEQIDPQFGDEATFRDLVDALHARGIKLVLDAVFNHCGERFPPFQDVLQRGADSTYAAWFSIQTFPVQQEPLPNYETFAFTPRMPKLMTRHPEVRRYLLDVARRWTALGVDGWRLDVANEVDHDFWRAFRQTVRAVNPQTYIVGELWHRAEPWLQGDQFDAVMNYPFRAAALDFFARGGDPSGGWAIGPETLDARLAGLRMAYTDPVNDALLNLLGSHDTPRILTLCGGADPRPHRQATAKRRAALAAVFQLTYPGAPMLYYGDEVGMGARGDAEVRYPMVWDAARQDAELLSLYKRLIGLRRGQPALRTGGYVTLLADPLTNSYAFARTSPEDYPEAPVAVVALHNADVPHTVTVPVAELRLGGGTQLRDALTGVTHRVEAGELRLDVDPWQSAVLLPEGAN